MYKLSTLLEESYSSLLESEKSQLVTINMHSFIDNNSKGVEVCLAGNYILLKYGIHPDTIVKENIRSAHCISKFLKLNNQEAQRFLNTCYAIDYMRIGHAKKAAEFLNIPVRKPIFDRSVTCYHVNYMQFKADLQQELSYLQINAY